MSEYQYYEFQTIDKPLTDEQMRELRSYSTRANITRTSFTNHYEWGDFQGDPDAWMERSFDAFLYLANWGTHVFKLRMPSRLLDLRDLAQRDGREREFRSRLEAIYVVHARKPAFIERLHKAGL